MAGVTGGESLAVFSQLFVAGKHELPLHRMAADNVVTECKLSLSLPPPSLPPSLTMTP